jgi:hypothetical protein
MTPEAKEILDLFSGNFKLFNTTLHFRNSKSQFIGINEIPIQNTRLNVVGMTESSIFGLK